MTKNTKTLIILTVILVSGWFIYIERPIIGPFLLAAIFAYIVNPLVNFFSHKIRLPRTISILTVYSLIVLFFSVVAIVITSQISIEAKELASESKLIIRNTEKELESMPEWLQGFFKDSLESIKNTTFVEPARALPIFSGALSKVLSLLIFLLSGFYFLKEGNRTIEKLTIFLPNDSKVEVEILMRKINAVLGNYLRGQLLLIFIMAILYWIILSIIGVKYALVIAIFSGFAEIVPVIGPVIASAIAASVAVFGGVSYLNISPIAEAAVVIAAYFLLNQFENIFIVPQVLGRVTRLHPLIILFAVLAGGHLLGILGMILAVPIAASLKILIDYFSDKIKEETL